MYILFSVLSFFYLIWALPEIVLYCIVVLDSKYKCKNVSLSHLR